MKPLLPLCFGIILTGTAYSLYNAANDYGLATISLPPAITAQIDDTSLGGDGTSGNPTDCKRPGFICNAIQDESSFYYYIKADAYGFIRLTDNSKVRLLPNTVYDIKEKYIDCIYSVKKTDVCNTDKCGSYLISAKPVGDGTN